MSRQQSKEGIFSIKAYCSICGKMLMESARLTKKRLFATWDAAVIGAASIKCEECGTKLPNYNINLKVVNNATHVEMDPKDIIPKPKDPGTMDDFLRVFGQMKKEAQEAKQN